MTQDSWSVGLLLVLGITNRDILPGICFVFVRHRVLVCRQVVILQDDMLFGSDYEVQD